MSFKSIGAAALIRLVMAGAALGGAFAVSAPAMANTASVDQVQAGQLSNQIVNAVRNAKLNADCQAWDSVRNRRDPKTQLPYLNRNNQSACPVCTGRVNDETNPLCRIDETAPTAQLNSRRNAQAVCQSCQAAIEAAIQGAITASGANPFTAQAALAQAQVQLASDGSMDGSTMGAFATVSSIVNQLASTESGSTGAGAPSGPGVTNSISSPPSSSGGGGYVSHH